MGNTISSGRRRCGLCYFKLPRDTPFLETPRAQRRMLPIHPTPDWQDGALDDVAAPTDKIWIIEIKTALAALKASADRGCVGCAALWQIRTERIEGAGHVTDEPCLSHDCVLRWDIGQEKVSSVSIDSLVCVDGSTYKQVTHAVRIESQGSDYGHPSAIAVSRAVAEGYTGSEASLQNAKAWLAECEASHLGCRPPIVPLPFRILELSQGPDGRLSARLRQDAKLIEPYACLSHRWGPSTHRCRTLKANLADHLESVPWELLLKTFQQAAIVTLKLGMKYLWIDSLCIVQDDTEDWKSQAAQMCDIYRGSRITIAATNSTDSDDGLFRRVDKVALEPTGRRRVEATMRILPGHSSNPRGEAEESASFPLLTRGWVYQERLLSSRVVHFSRHELSFECQQPQVQCECGMNMTWYDKSTHMESLHDTSIINVRNHWHELVYAFSALHLTFYSDLLPALAGIARQHGSMHKFMLGRYVAGLWEKTLLHDLVWYTGNGYQSQRPKACAAPSWSWAAKTGGNSWLAYPKATDDLSIVFFKVDLAGPDEYGPVLPGAELTVWGYLAPGSWKKVPKTFEGPSQRTVEFVHWVAANDSTKTYYLFMDYQFSTEGEEGYIESGSTLYLLKTGFIGVGRHVCLVLRPVDNRHGFYERVGMVQEATQDDVDAWFGDAPQQILKLV